MAQVKSLSAFILHSGSSPTSAMPQISRQKPELLGSTWDIGNGSEKTTEKMPNRRIWRRGGTATGTRDAVYGEMMFSMLCGVTEQDWFDLLSHGNAVGGGLMSRFNMIGTEGEYENVSKMNPPNFTSLQETFLPRVMRLEDAHANMLPTEGADKVISEWSDNLPEGSERMNVHAWRSALLLAWLRHEERITAKTAEDAVRLGQYQLASHDYYRTKAADNVNARIQAKLLRALELKGPLFKRELQQRTNAHRDGTKQWMGALDGLLRDKAIGQREDGAYYLAE